MHDQCPYAVARYRSRREGDSHFDASPLSFGKAKLECLSDGKKVIYWVTLGRYKRYCRMHGKFTQQISTAY